MHLTTTLTLLTLLTGLTLALPTPTIHNYPDPDVDFDSSNWDNKNYNDEWYNGNVIARGNREKERQKEEEEEREREEAEKKKKKDAYAQAYADSTFYFAYGSNLWEHQMQQRCPASKLIGVARLEGHRWFISSTGSANITADSGAETFGLVYSLQPTDKAVLDSREGVPDRHSKETATVSLSTPTGAGKQEVEALVYIDDKHLQPGQPKGQYVYRMNQSISDAIKRGMPEGYVRDVLRAFIPETWDEGVEEEARRRVLVSGAWEADQDKKR
ncbi:hypothetical protein PRZ48_006967 [Zasmidium cellare]|uniref:gamma-glutamylcyclotransferase n=1 Tax=Zasmidium cellare TaxID=395010 RepID=A0ABR0EIT7_ZASCE|nr:hypothetical protein PRZ48_006967 [Zasmidium cellare]